MKARQKTDIGTSQSIEPMKHILTRSSVARRKRDNNKIKKGTLQERGGP